MITSVLAQNNFGDTESDGLAGPMGLLIIVLLAVATVLLIRNMNSRLRRLPERFPSQPGPTTARAGQPDDSDRPATPLSASNGSAPNNSASREPPTGG
jgi:hypothetical protein